MLQVVADENDRRILAAQLNVSEGRHALGRRIFFRHRDDLRQHYREGMENQLDALGLALNAVVPWNSPYVDAAVKKLAADGFRSPKRCSPGSRRCSSSTSTSSAATPSPAPTRMACAQGDPHTGPILRLALVDLPGLRWSA